MDPVDKNKMYAVYVIYKQSFIMISDQYHNVCLSKNFSDTSMKYENVWRRNLPKNFLLLFNSYFDFAKCKLK